ncbi:MAG: hypothetical protein ACM3VZ_04495 [Acidobacteriota bacterium]
MASATETNPIPASSLNWFDAPAYLTELWFQSMKPVTDVQQLQSGRDLMTAPMAVCVEEAMLIAKVFNSLVQTQMQCWTEMQNGMVQLMTAADPSHAHANPDSAGAVLCPPEDLSPVGAIQNAGNVMGVMADAFMTAVRHDLEDEAPEWAKPADPSAKPQ